MRHDLASVAAGALLVCIAAIWTSDACTSVPHTAAGRRWSPVGDVEVPLGNEPPQVVDLLVHNGELVASGVCLLPASPGSEDIARLSGGTWVPLGDGPPVDFDAIVDMESFHGRLIVAGTQSGRFMEARALMQWDGVVWRTVGDDPMNFYSVRDMVVFEDDLVVAGQLAPPDPSTDYPLCLARWDGESWTLFATGISGSLIRTLAVYRGELIAGGSFDSSRGYDLEHIARWDGRKWRPLKEGTNQTVQCPGMFALEVYESNLIVGGQVGSRAWSGIATVLAWRR